MCVRGVCVRACVRACVRPSVRLSVCPSVRLSGCLAGCLSVCMSVCMSACRPVGLSAPAHVRDHAVSIDVIILSQHQPLLQSRFVFR